MTAVEKIYVDRYRRVVVLTGAGISVASGLPTYRGAGGLWTTDPANEKVNRASALAEDPDGVWRLFSGMRAAALAAKPNAAHLALAAAEKRVVGAGGAFTIVTQNVDGLHGRAGSADVAELHGTVMRTRCTRCELAPFADERSYASAPPCPSCGAPLRPDVVLFDEPLPVDAEWRAKQALRDCDLFVAIGTSGTVSPASNFVRAAEYERARTIYVNLEPMTPPNPAFQEIHLGRAEDLIPALLRA